MTKTILLSLALAMSGMTAIAQDAPNRVIVHNNAGGYTSFNLGTVDKMSFATVEGVIACDVKVNKFTNTSINLDATMTEGCYSFQIGVFPGVQARSFTKSSEQTKAYLDQANAPRYNEDFIGGQMTGIDLTPGTEWAVVTLGYDGYNTPCEVRADYFTTAAADLVGNPQVSATLLEAGLTTLKFKFESNKDVLDYSFVIFEKGQFNEQYEMFAPMFGFTNPGQMIQMWGSKHEGGVPFEYEYTDMNPNTEYELYIQATDINGNFAPMVRVDCATAKMGGSGEATVDVKIGNYRLEEWDGEMKPSQFITFTPNDQSWCYRYNVVLASGYDQQPDAYKEDLQSEPPMPMAYWFFYEPMTTDFQIDPNTECVVIASAKNADGVWGPINEVRFTTPASVQGMPAVRTGKVEKRQLPTPAANRRAIAPAMQRISLTH